MLSVLIAQHDQGSWMYYIFRCKIEIFILTDPAVAMPSMAGSLPPQVLSCVPCLFRFNTGEVSGFGKLQFP